MTALRIGQGSDIHRLAAGRSLMLGGLKVPHDKGCVAHSDGDVLIHALIDSLLGAAGRGDIGTYFPDTDPQYKDIASMELLARTLILLPPLTIINTDITVHCETPRIGPLRAAITASLAKALNIDSSRINLKGKTAERLGDIGRGAAIMAEAVTLIKLKGDQP